MEDEILTQFLKLVDEIQSKGFVCDVTSRRIIFHFSDEHQRIYLTEINQFIDKLGVLIDIERDKIHIVKEYKYLELWIPLKNEISNLESLKDEKKVN